MGAAERLEPEPIAPTGSRALAGAFRRSCTKPNTPQNAEATRTMKKKKPVPREGADWSPTPRRSIRRSLIATGWTPLLRATLPGSGLIQWTFLKGSHAATGEGRTEADALAEAYAAAKKHDERRGAP